MSFRAMTHLHVDAATRIEHEGHPLDAWHAEAFRDAVAALRTYVCRVAVEPASGVVGYAVVSLATDQGDLQNLTVRADRRRQGLGRRLLDDALGEVAGRGVREVFLEVRHDNAAAIGLYASYGFNATGRRRNYYARGVDAVLMRLALGGHASGGDLR